MTVVHFRRRDADEPWPIIGHEGAFAKFAGRWDGAAGRRLSESLRGGESLKRRRGAGDS